MRYDEFFITCPTEEIANVINARFEESKRLHAAIFELVSGYDNKASSWTILNDCLAMSNHQMESVIEMLQEKAG